MRVFISSVRKGLEEERDALPGLIQAIGHHPVRFEDFSAQTTPSREACLSALDQSDVYLLILGPKYGHRFPETGQSPTHEEWTAANSRGMTRIVYRKQGVQFEDEQQELSRQIGNYGTGVFYDTSTSVGDLLTKVASKVRELEEAEPALTYEALAETPIVEWRVASGQGRSTILTGNGPQLELHVIPIGQVPYSGRVMTQLSDSLVARVRREGSVDAALALNQKASDESCVVEFQDDRTRSWNQPSVEMPVGIRLLKTGQLSIWSTLPHNGMASVLDSDRLREQIARMLRLIGNLGIVESERVAIAVGVDPVNMLTVGHFDEHRASDRAFNIKTTDAPLRVEPDESVSLAALGVGASEIAGVLARALVDGWQARR